MTVPRTPTTKGQPRPVPPPPPVQVDPDERHDGDVEAIRALRCLDALWLAASRRLGTDVLDQVLLDAIEEADPGRDWSKPRRQAARELAEQLFRGRQ